MAQTQNYTSMAEIDTIYATLRRTFKSGLTKPIAWRRHQLLQLARLTQENGPALAEAIRKDLGRPAQEVFMAEIGPIVDRSVQCAEKVGEWAATVDKTNEVPEWQRSWRPRVETAPKGVALLIAPWNYPLILSLQPLYGAISAGCAAALKVSEITPNYADLIAELLPKYLDSDAYRVITGGVPEITRLLELKWDHIFYTGNGRVARIISAAAAKHLTPLTLELGGKSPVIVDPNYDLDLAAKRIIWGKINNAGQICVSPDYILTTATAITPLVTAMQAHLKAFYPNGALASNDYSRIVSELHFDRLKNLLARTKGRVVIGGRVEEPVEGKKGGIEPTVLVDVKEDDILLESEIFGPIIPIVTVENVHAAIDFINARDHPLVLYAFTEDEELKKSIIQDTTSGNVSFNDTFQFVSLNELPFGGVGESGHGNQVLKYSFNAFSYERAVSDTPKSFEPFNAHRYPPYTEASEAFMKTPSSIPIPHSEAPPPRE